MEMKKPLGITGFEPHTKGFLFGGDGGARTHDLTDVNRTL